MGRGTPQGAGYTKAPPQADSSEDEHLEKFKGQNCYEQEEEAKDSKRWKAWPCPVCSPQIAPGQGKPLLCCLFHLGHLQRCPIQNWTRPSLE